MIYVHSYTDVSRELVVFIFGANQSTKNDVAITSLLPSCHPAQCVGLMFLARSLFLNSFCDTLIANALPLAPLLRLRVVYALFYLRFALIGFFRPRPVCHLRLPNSGFWTWVYYRSTQWCSLSYGQAETRKPPPWYTRFYVTCLLHRLFTVETRFRVYLAL